jgi:hypothetical protein
LFGSIHEENKNAIVLDSFMGVKLLDDGITNARIMDKFIPWTLRRNDFETNKESKCNIRDFVKYAKTFNF